MVRGNVVRHAGGTGIYPDVGADWVTLAGNVLLPNAEPAASCRADAACAAIVAAAGRRSGG